MEARDCDAGMALDTADVPDYNPEDRIYIVDDEPDNVAMIARDLAALRQRWYQLEFKDVGGRYRWESVFAHFMYLENEVNRK